MELCAFINFVIIFKFAFIGNSSKLTLIHFIILFIEKVKPYGGCFRNTQHIDADFVSTCPPCQAVDPMRASTPYLPDLQPYLQHTAGAQ